MVTTLNNLRVCFVEVSEVNTIESEYEHGEKWNKNRQKSEDIAVNKFWEAQAYWDNIKQLKNKI